MNRYNVGRRIEAYRIRIKMSTQQLAERIKRSQATISRIENGKQGISIELLAKIAAELKVHPFALLSDEPLRHSVLLPVSYNKTGSDQQPIHLLADMLAIARLKQDISSEQAAKDLSITVEELETLECGYSLPDPELLERMSKLYGLDLKELNILAKMEQDTPELSKRISMLHKTLRQLNEVVNTDNTGPENEKLSKVKDLIHKVDKEVTNVSHSTPGEIQAVLNRISANFLSALEDEDFRDQVMSLTKNKVEAL